MLIGTEETPGLSLKIASCCQSPRLFLLLVNSKEEFVEKLFTDCQKLKINSNQWLTQQWWGINQITAACLCISSILPNNWLKKLRNLIKRRRKAQGGFVCAEEWIIFHEPLIKSYVQSFLVNLNRTIFKQLNSLLF